MVRKSDPPSNVRILDGQNSAPSPESSQASPQSSTSSTLPKTEVDIGLDVSTSVIGVCVLDRNTGAMIKLFPVKLTSSKLQDIWDKSLEFEREFKKELDPTWDVKRIFVEDVAKMFSPGFSSAGTIVILAKMNAIACLITFKLLGIKPTFINVRSARAQLSIKIDTKDKSKSTKEKVFEKVLAMNTTFPWMQHIAKTGKSVGQMVYDTCNQDMGDAWVAAKGGQKLFP